MGQCSVGATKASYTLQFRFEIGSIAETAQVLAQAAYDSTNLGSAAFGYSIPIGIFYVDYELFSPCVW